MLELAHRRLQMNYQNIFTTELPKDGENKTKIVKADFIGCDHGVTRPTSIRLFVARLT